METTQFPITRRKSANKQMLPVMQISGFRSQRSGHNWFVSGSAITLDSCLRKDSPAAGRTTAVGLLGCAATATSTKWVGRQLIYATLLRKTSPHSLVSRLPRSHRCLVTIFSITITRWYRRKTHVQQWDYGTNCCYETVRSTASFQTRGYTSNSNSWAAFITLNKTWLYTVLQIINSLL